MRVVIDLGGSVVASPTPNVTYIKDFSNLLVKLHKEGYKIMVVVGGGNIAKEYIASARELGAGEKSCDLVGIAAARLNAMLLTSALGSYALGRIPESVDNVETEKILVMGGVKPGQTTDAVAAELAAVSSADLLVIATNVDGVYDSDPKKSRSAKKIPRLTAGELVKIVSDGGYKAGSANVVDPVAARIIRDRKIRTIVVDGRNIDNIKNAILGKKHNGTLISD
ncbi:MAG: UMP kinase [Candidatus Hydrothermarchaeaceae archaeon]